jgi:hypothetical protein
MTILCDAYLSCRSQLRFQPLMIPRSIVILSCTLSRERYAVPFSKNDRDAIDLFAKHELATCGWRKAGK